MPNLIWPLGGTPPGMDPKKVKRVRSPKAPGDTVPITCDFAGPLNIIEDDYLSETQPPTAVACRNDGGASDLVIIGNGTVDATQRTRVTLWFSQGTAGYEYLVEVTAYAQSGQTIVRGFLLPVNIR